MKSMMARINVAALLAVVACLLGLALAQEQILLQNAKQKNLVDVQFFADSNFQQTRTPFAYFDFPAIQQGSCTQCEDFQVLFGCHFKNLLTHRNESCCFSSCYLPSNTHVATLKRILVNDNACRIPPLFGVLLLSLGPQQEGKSWTCTSVQTAEESPCQLAPMLLPCHPTGRLSPLSFAAQVE